MRLTLLFFLLGLIHVSAAVHSQNQRVNLDCKQIELKKIFKEITKQTDLDFFYSGNELNVDKKISVIADYKKLDDVLSVILGADYTYSIEDNIILIRPVKVFKESTEAEKITIKGKVVDNEGLSLPGVSVVVKSTNTGVATDIDGNFEIQLDKIKTITLVFSFVGMKTKEVVVNINKFVNVVLESASKDLEEVVITGYQTLSKERSTGSFEKISSETLDNKITLNITQKIEGQATGLLYNEDGSMVIRGVGTINGESDPLIVYDGFPIEKEFIESINPNDIESINVLKDAAAASIWGAKAANGVIVITSKRLKNNRSAMVRFSSSYSFENKPKLSDIPFASTKSLIEMQEHMAKNTWFSQTGYPAYPEVITLNNQLTSGAITKDFYDARVNQLKNIDIRDEYGDLLLQNKTRKNYDLAIFGKSDKNSYYLSLNYDDLNDFAIGNTEDRISVNLKNSMNLSDKLTLYSGVNIYVKNSENNGIGLSGLTDLPQYQNILDKDGNYVIQETTISNARKEELVTEGRPYDWDYNILRDQRSNEKSGRAIMYKINLGLDYDIIAGLKAELKYQYDCNNYKFRKLLNEESYYTRNLVNDFTILDKEANELVNIIPVGSILDRTYSEINKHTLKGLLKYNKAFGENNFVAMIGGEIIKNNSQKTDSRVYGYDDQILDTDYVNYVDKFYIASTNRRKRVPYLNKEMETENRYISYFGNFSYTYAQKYNASFSARVDDSNLFGASPKYRNVPLWSFGLKWNINNEEFFNCDLFDRLNLRFTTGTGGNIDKSTSPFVVLVYSKNRGSSLPMAYMSNPKNPLLRWEKTKTNNLGIDFALLKNRLSGSVELYSKYSSDLLGNQAFNATYGITSAKYNTASVSNKGLDAKLNGLILDKDIKWGATITFSYNKNRVEKVELPSKTVFEYLKSSPAEGKPLGYIYAYKWASLSQDGFSQVYDAEDNIVDYKNQMLDVDGLKYCGNTTPKYYGSVLNNISYKGLTFSMTVLYKLGYKFRAPVMDYGNYKYIIPNFMHKDFENRWKNIGDEKLTNIPRLPEGKSDDINSSKYFKNADINVLDASHLRFRDISLNYRLPENIINKLNVSELQMGLQVRNLGVVAFNKRDIDPSYTQLTDFSSIVLPPNPEYTFNIKVTF